MSGVDWSIVPSAEEAGEEMHALMRELYPIPRSLSGDGNRRTLEIVSQYAPLDVTEVPSGTQAFDWTVPKEWNIRDAWIRGPDGGLLVDFKALNFHVLGYSVPVSTRLPLSELDEHLFSDPARPDVVPYRTSYYAERWGFCISDRVRASLADGEYEVLIDSTLADGSITYAESVIPGEREEEVLLSTYICHPSLCNDNLSGIVLLALLGRTLHALGGLRYTYRLLFGPGSIGPITWLARNEARVDRIRHGLVASCVGDPGGFTYKRSRRGDTEVDRAVENVLRDFGEPYEVRDWIPWGGDERQFCSPGFDLPVGALSRTPADAFPEYHSSADDLDFVRPEQLGGAFRLYLTVIDVLERNERWVNQNPKCEPQLGKRGLYRSVGGGSSREQSLLWVLSLADGEHSLLDISARSGVPFSEITEAAAALAEHGLLAPPAEYGR